MRLAGTSDSGWIVIDLGDVADAIASVRQSTTAQRLRAQQQQQRERRGRDDRLPVR